MSTRPENKQGFFRLHDFLRLVCSECRSACKWPRGSGCDRHATAILPPRLPSFQVPCWHRSRRSFHLAVFGTLHCLVVTLEIEGMLVVWVELHSSSSCCIFIATVSRRSNAILNPRSSILRCVAASFRPVNYRLVVIAWCPLPACHACCPAWRPGGA